MIDCSWAIKENTFSRRLRLNSFKKNRFLVAHSVVVLGFELGWDSYSGEVLSVIGGFCF